MATPQGSRARVTESPSPEGRGGSELAEERARRDAAEQVQSVSASSALALQLKDQELEETRSKYHLLKSKVRKYQKHVEAKEDHYKSEYARLEAEFRGTLEKLRERMEAAYSSKERLVDSELGQMRDQLSREMRNIIRTGDSHSSPVDSDLLSEKPVKLVN